MKDKKIWLWLDDIRPAPAGWVHVKTIEAAKEYLEKGIVFAASLDHDLGACQECYSKSSDEWLVKHSYQSMPHCPHVGTGYDLVCWMEETGYWPDQRPAVHSANPVGRQRMNQAIDASFKR